MERSPRQLAAILALAFGAQAGGVAGLAGAGVPLALAIAAAAGLASRAVLGPALRSAPSAAAMLALGGLGMVVGWWADLGFESAATVARDARAPLDPLWCRSPAGTGALAGLPGVGHLLCWMNAGMLALGVPAARLARPPGAPPGGAGLACALAMVVGMALASQLAALAAAGLPPAAAVSLDYGAMLAGMGAAMAAAERALSCEVSPARRRLPRGL